MSRAARRADPWSLRAIAYRPTAARAFRHTLAEDVAKRPVRPRRRFLRR